MGLLVTSPISICISRLERVSQDLNLCFQLNEGGRAVTSVFWMWTLFGFQ
jgi:hypothetical protein